MKHPLEDPNSHAPEPAADADWCDGFVDDRVIARHLAGSVAGIGGPPAGSVDDGGRLKIQARGLIEPRRFRQRAANDDPVLRIEPIVKEAELARAEKFTVNRIGEVVRLESAEGVEAVVQGEGFLPERTEAKFAPAPKKQRRRGVAHEWGRAGQHSRGWIALTVLGVVGILAGGLVLHSNLSGRDEGSGDAIQLVLEPVVEIDLAAMFDADLTAEGEARQILAAVAAARQVDELLPWVRGGAGMREKLAAGWQPWNAPAGWQPDGDSIWEVGQMADFGFGVLSGFRADYERFRAYFVREGDRLLLDWEATEAVSSESFARLLRGEGAGGEMRVLAQRGDFHTLVMPEDEFRAVQLLSPGQETILWGYARRGSAADVALGKLFDDGLIVEAEATTLPLTLQLIPPPPNSLPNQWEISAVLHEEWVHP